MAKLYPFLPFPEEAVEQEIQPEPPAAYLPPDAPARAQALDIRRSFIVEAPAGSGKTGLLIQRFLKLLADDSVTSPEQVLGITFTQKATAELRDRVLAHLESANLEPRGAPGLASETWEAAPQNSRDQPAKSAASATIPFAVETRAFAHAVLERDRQLGWDLLAHPHRLNLRTIDSVCAEIARTLPVLSGSGGRLAPVADATPLHREAARRTLLQLGGSDPVLDGALRNLLLHRDGNLADCETLVADMLAVRDQWGTLIPLTQPHLDDAWLDAEVLPRLQKALEQVICAELTKLSSVFDQSLLADLTELAEAMSHSAGHKGLPSPIAICKGRNQSPAAAAENLGHWHALIHLLVKPSKPRDWRKAVGANVLKFEIEKHHEAQLKSVLARISGDPDLMEMLCRIDSLPPAVYPTVQWAVAKSLFRVLNHALVELQLVFATRGQCDFTELTLLARAALTADSGPDDLAAALGARLQHLLVDEMQDTSSSQYDLIQLLTASWDGHSQTLFLVGDPRQSIYLFRQARVERFLRTMRTRRLGDLPLTHLQLTANFRSQKTLVDQFNVDFGSVFRPAGSSASEVDSLPYSNADSVLPPSDHASSRVWHANPVEIRPSQTQATSDSWRPFTPAQLRQRQAYRNAREMRRIALHWLSKPLPANRSKFSDGTPKPWQIAVLVRNRSHLAEVVAEFDSAKRGRIPYRAVEITPLNERLEILDLTALTRAILHPADRVAALAVLRAPWCGLSLADLLLLTGADDPQWSWCSVQTLMKERGDLLGEEAIQRMQRVWRVLSGAAALRARLSTSQLVERAWRSLGGDAWLTGPELVNTRRFFSLLDEMEAELGAPGRIDPTLLHARMQRLYAEPNAIPPGEPFVELLTMHKAKGLEWDVVMVPALERSPGISRGRLLTWSELDCSGDEAASIMLAPIAAKGEEVDALTTWLKTVYKDREAAERKRLFYVAATRAREELHLFASPDLLANGNMNPRYDTLLKSAWAAAQPQFAGAITSRQSGPGMVPSSPVIQKEAAVIPSLAEPILLDLAATAEPLLQPLHRVPITFDPAQRFTAAHAIKLPYAESGTAESSAPAADAKQFSRPEGSFAARAFGTVVHGFIETLSARIASGQTPTALFHELPTWMPRIKAVLRADGLPPATVERMAREAHAALANMLRDRDGLWLLAAHPGAAIELALTALSTPDQGDPTARLASVRIDRLFQAGPEPHLPGDSHLWIVDYKTSDHGPSGLEAFLTRQRETYAPQLETYASILASAQPIPKPQIRLALYYPTLPKLIWWTL